MQKPSNLKLLEVEDLGTMLVLHFNQPVAPITGRPGAYEKKWAILNNNEHAKESWVRWLKRNNVEVNPGDWELLLSPEEHRSLLAESPVS